MIRKSFSAETKALDEQQGIVEAIVNVGAVLDLQDDVMMPGCWGDVIKGMKAGEVEYPSVVWGHDWSIITGKVLDTEEIPPGSSKLPEKIANAGGSALRIVAQYNLDTQRGREAFSDVKGGYVKQWSVGFEPDAAGVRFEKGVRMISKVGRWPEVSNVLIGASPGTHTVAVKALNPDELEERHQRSRERLEKALELLELVTTEELATFAEIGKGAPVTVTSNTAVEDKDGAPPTLTGPEAAHNKPLAAALAAVKTLITQELAEDYPEPDCVMRLTCIWQDLLSWAQGEAVEYADYGSLPMAMSAYLGAGIRKLAEVPDEEPEPDEPDETMELSSFLRAVVETPLELFPSPPQQYVPDDSDDGLPYLGQMRARR